MTPPAAINPMGDEICKTSLVMVCPDDSRPFAVFHRLTQLAIFFSIDEGQDFRNRWIGSRQIPRLVETLGKDAGPVKQLLIKRSYHREALAGELAAFHADDVEADEARKLADRKAKRDHVAAHPGEPAHHHLRAHPAELMHRRQAADENKIADLGVAPQRRRGGKSHVIPHDAVVTDVAAIHEITAIPDLGNAATG